MSQMNVYVPDKIEKEIRKKAKKLGKSISSFLTDILSRNMELKNAWHPDFFSKILGKWQGDFSVPKRVHPEERDDL